MSVPADNHLPLTAEPCVTGRRYHSAAFIISCIVIAYMTARMFMSPTSADQLATLTLASYYTLIRMIQLISIRKPYNLLLHLHGPLVVFDQFFLLAVALGGVPLFLTLPLSGTLVFMTRSLAVKYRLMTMPAAFASILVTLLNATDVQLNTASAAAISLILVFAFSFNSIIPLIRPVIRKRNTLDARNSQQSETQDAIQEPQPIAGHISPVEDRRANLRILIISTNDFRLRSLTDYLNNWGYDYTTSNNSVQAFRHMLSRYQANRFVPYTTLIVDQQGLDLDPVSLARLIQSEPKLEGMRLICLKAPFSLHHQHQVFHQAGYHTLLDSPLQKAQLFSALHGVRLHYPDPTNIISLCKHRSEKSSKTGQGIILLADTPSPARTHLSKTLTQAGYRLLMIDDGDRALDMLEERRISLVIINIKLPVMSGVQVLKLHRFTTPHNQWVPFAFLSDENSADTLRLCRSIGVQACFFKPVIANDILEMLPTLLSQHQSADRRINHNRRLAKENNVTQFRNPSLLDHMTLLRLEKLDSGIAFINDLFRIFEAEGHAIVRTMKQAVEKKQLGLFLDQAQILLDSAGQLGALSLYELCRNAIKLRAYEFDHRGCQIMEEIEKSFNLTLKAYSNHLSQRAATLQSDRKQ